MHVKTALSAVALCTVAACASPLERCLYSSERSVTRLERAIAVADANIARGYALHEVEEPIVLTKHCHDKKGRKYRCDVIETHTTEVPVEIDIWHERARREALRDDLKLARSHAKRQSDQCFAAHPEG